VHSLIATSFYKNYLFYRCSTLPQLVTCVCLGVSPSVKVFIFTIKVYFGKIRAMTCISALVWAYLSNKIAVVVYNAHSCRFLTNIVNNKLYKRRLSIVNGRIHLKLLCLVGRLFFFYFYFFLKGPFPASFSFIFVFSYDYN